MRGLFICPSALAQREGFYFGLHLETGGDSLREQGPVMQSLRSPSALFQLTNISEKASYALAGALIFLFTASKHLQNANSGG